MQRFMTTNALSLYLSVDLSLYNNISACLSTFASIPPTRILKDTFARIHPFLDYIHSGEVMMRVEVRSECCSTMQRADDHEES